ncbi:MAG TPA: LexA family transcriptional regulator [Terriglobales bacterium]|nr:LexA family transcriptional regulator [Terriglobales bacterium]
MRRILMERIQRRELTGLKLAHLTGFRQAHISNFLNRKRSLSMEGLDKVLQVQHLSVLDLLDPGEINKRASIIPPSEDDFENVLLVEGIVAATQPLIKNQDVKEILKFKKTFLKRLRPHLHTAARNTWSRFVMVKVDTRDGMAMYPKLLPGATVLIDRHYNALESYRRGEPNMYAVPNNAGCTVRYVEVSGRALVLRPHNQDFPIDVIQMEQGQSFADYIVGRVCHVAIET